MRYLFLLLFVPPLLLGIAGALFTNNKLHKMNQIRGWEPGATVVTEVVRQKYIDPEDGTCWIAIADVSIRQPGPHRLNLTPEKWTTYEIGDPIEIVYLPGNRWPDTRDGIYASDGNFEFDRGLLMLELGITLVSVLGAAGTLAILIAVGRSKKSAIRPKRGRRVRYH